MTEERNTVAKAEQAEVPEAVVCFSKLVRSVELIDIRLVSAEAKLTPTEATDFDDLKITAAPTEFTAFFHEEERTLHCGVRFEMFLSNQRRPKVATDTLEDSETESVDDAAAEVVKADAPSETTDDDVNAAAAAVSIFAEYHLLYTVPEGVEVVQEGADLFASQNGAFNAWPLFRELVHSMGCRMGIPPLLIPLLRFPLMPPKRSRNRT